uniref:WD repeat-containing protein 44 n=1 Tax=Schistocephalus solidus TaxID=70667 RepID=A0A183SY61_SCHSO
LDNGTTYSRGEVPELGEVADPVPIKLPQQRAFYRSQPLLVYRGHDGVVTELAWSKNLFLLSTGMDRQVRLWHVSRCECLCVFSHSDTVPAIVFHPKDDRYFLSGSLDGKLRLWNIPDKKVRFWVDPKTIITCACFACDGTKVVIGSYDGRVMFFNTELTYITFINVKSSSSRGRQCRVTAIELLVTSNDSRVRLIDARDYHTLCKYRGFVNESSQIRASFSPTARYIISGSENCFFYIWRKQMDFLNVSRFSTSQSIKAHDAAVTVAIFLPNPGLLLDKRLRRWNSARRRTGGDLRLRSYLGDSKAGIGPNSRHMPYLGEVIVSADSRGCIRVLKNRVHKTAAWSESAAT